MNSLGFALVLFVPFVVAIWMAYLIGKQAGREETPINVTNHIMVDEELIVAALKGGGYRIVRDEEKRTEH